LTVAVLCLAKVQICLTVSSYFVQLRKVRFFECGYPRAAWAAPSTCSTSPLTSVLRIQTFLTATQCVAFSQETHSSLRQLLAVLFAHHVLGIPVRPVLVGLPNSRLVLSVCGGRTPQRARKVARRREGRRPRIEATRYPSGDLL